MILFDARCAILPERNQDFMHEFKKISPNVRREAGCTRYELFTDISVPDHFHVLEEWESEKHLKGPSRTTAYAGFFYKNAPLEFVPGPIENLCDPFIAIHHEG